MNDPVWFGVGVILGMTLITLFLIVVVLFDE